MSEGEPQSRTEGVAWDPWVSPITACAALRFVPNDASLTPLVYPPTCPERRPSRSYSLCCCHPALPGSPQHTQFCLAPDGNDGGWGGRDKESMNAGCIPVYINDNTTRYFDEVLSPDLYSLEIPESDIPHIPKRVQTAAKAIREYQQQMQCACRVRGGLPRWRSGGAARAARVWPAGSCHRRMDDSWPLCCSLSPG